MATPAGCQMVGSELWCPPGTPNVELRTTGCQLKNAGSGLQPFCLVTKMLPMMAIKATGFQTTTPGAQTTTGQTMVGCPDGYTIDPMTGVCALATPWYKTWWGIGLLGVGGFFAYKHFSKKAA